jgi:hypothetical protein
LTYTPSRTPAPPTATVTITPTPTETPTPTPTFTPTPVLAFIGNTGGVGTVLRQAPEGAIAGFLPDGAPVRVLYRRETVGRTEWIEVKDALDRTGWVPAQFLEIKP